ncbi:MAG: ATP-binding protein [Coriobacteriia bacterium]|nr:ATP-binding protein [Coriobacteriia bacterium]
MYDDLLSAPRIIDIEPAPVLDFIESIASTTYDFAQKQGGGLPYSVIREIAENFIHASFVECTVSVLNKGNTVCFSDQGPGIERKRLVQRPGITSATSEMKRYIRGVGSGFPIVKEYLDHRNGFLQIDDNAQKGTVITLSVHDEALGSSAQVALSETPQNQQTLKGVDQRSLKVLRLLYEKGTLGPSDLMDPLGISAATAHRILVGLEQKGLVVSAPHRKRILSSAGVTLLEAGDIR